MEMIAKIKNETEEILRRVKPQAMTTSGETFQNAVNANSETSADFGAVCNVREMCK
jgi:hypothetical protein